MVLPLGHLIKQPRPSSCGDKLSLVKDGYVELLKSRRPLANFFAGSNPSGIASHSPRLPYSATQKKERRQC